MQTQPASRPARPAGLAVTATTLVALAMSAAVTGPLTGPLAGHAPRDIDARLESHVVRAVAAAVAAAARDLLIVERSAAAPIEPVFEMAPIVSDRAVTPAPVTTFAMTMLSERQLDLPPPTG